MKQLNKITPRNKDFSQWYTDIVINTNLASYSSVKGMIIFKPYGYRIWELIQSYLDKEFKLKNVDNVYFPLLINESLFNKEKEHIEGFSPELATVTRIGNKILEEPLFIRPTSEVLIMNHFSKEVKSYRDLPLLYNQWCNVLRWEKTTRPFLRTSEFLWQEGHTIHSLSSEAETLTLDILKLYKKFANEILLLPVIDGKKTEFEKFAGAQDTYTIESMMYDGQALQCGTSHFFSNNFSKAYDIKFQNKNGELENAYSTSWGVSTRLIGAIIMTHSDDNGLILPSKISPIQIQIIQIGDSENIINTANNIKNRLSDFRVNIDKSDKTFGYKISEAEIKGIPIRIEIGTRDLENNSITISTRIDQKNKIKFDLNNIDNLNKEIETLISDYDKSLFNSALLNRENKTFTANTIDEYIDILKTNQGFVLVPFCCKKDCENDVKQKTSTNSRCIPFNVKHYESKCFNCSEKSDKLVYFARAY